MAVFFGAFAQQLAAVVVLSLIFLTGWFYWSHRKILRVAWGLKSPPALPIIGHGYFILRGCNWMVNWGIKFIKDVVMSEKFDKGVFWVGPYPFFIVTKPEDIHTLLNSTKSFEGGIEHQFLSYALGNGLITAPVNIWKVTRRHVNALFHPRNLEGLTPVLNDVARELVSSLAQQQGEGVVDVEPLIYPIALKSTCKLIFGPESEVNTKSDKFIKLMAAITRISQLAAERFVKVYTWPNSLFKILYRREIKQIEEWCDGFVIEAIEAHRKRRQSQNTSTQPPKDNEFIDNQDPDNEEQYADKLTQVTLEDTYNTLQENYPIFTDKDLCYEIRTILLGGSESTRVTLSACLLALAANPDIQERLHTEIAAVAGADVTPEDLRALPYLDQVLKETLRKFLVIPMVTRRVQEDLKLSDWTVPAGALVGVLTFGVHFNPRLYPDPERFDPDRFSPESAAARGRYSFIPFSSGPRNCIGKNYSMLVLKILLVQVLRRFRFSTAVDVDAQPLVGGVITGFQHGYRVTVEPRHQPPREPTGLQEPQHKPPREPAGLQDPQHKPPREPTGLQDPQLFNVLRGRCREDRFVD